MATRKKPVDTTSTERDRAKGRHRIDGVVPEYALKMFKDEPHGRRRWASGAAYVAFLGAPRDCQDELVKYLITMHAWGKLDEVEQKHAFAILTGQSSALDVLQLTEKPPPP